MWLALCDPSDAAGLWCVAGLRRLGLEPFEVLMPVELVVGTRVAHRLGAGARIECSDGRVIDGDSVRGVLNRLPPLPGCGTQRLSEVDRAYVREELHAHWTAVLFSLPCPVVNRPDPVGLGGPALTEAEWRMLAARAGLPARTLQRASWEEPAAGAERRTVATVVGDHVMGAPAGYADACRRLAALAGAPMLGLVFSAAGGDGAGRTFESAFSQPDLRPGGRAALVALARALGAAE